MKREQFKQRISHFLIENKWIDEMLAIKLGTEVREWALLERFCESRGLQRQLMEVIASIFTSELKSYSSTEYSVKRPHEFKGNSSKFVYSTLSYKNLQDITTKLISDMPMRERRSFLNCLVKTGNLLACIDDPELSIDLLDILLGALPFMDEHQLEQAVVQTEPRRCGYRPLILYPVLIKSSQCFIKPNTDSSSAPSSMIYNDIRDPEQQTRQMSGYKLVQSMLNFYICAQLAIIKIYSVKISSSRSLSSESSASALMEEGCESNPPKISSCDVNLVKSVINNKWLDTHLLVDDFLLRQSNSKNRLLKSAYPTETAEDIYDLNDVREPMSEGDMESMKESKTSKLQKLKDKYAMMKTSCSLLAAGPNHVLLNRPRSNVIMSWGSAEHGALGHEHTVPAGRYSPPREVAFFSALNNSHSVTKAKINNENDLNAYNDISSQECSDDFDLDQRLYRKEVLHALYPPITVFSVSCGKTHSMALTDKGVYAWGSSKYGQLGLGHQRQMTKRPEMIKRLSQCVVTSIACGHYHSVALDLKGRLWTWGWGVHGQLGLQDIEDEHIPRRVLWPQQLFDESICRISAGYAHTMVSTLAGNVWVFGCGLFGQLGNGDNKKSTLPIKVDFTIAINSEGVINDKMGMIACGYFHNLAVSQDGSRLYTWGCNPQLLRQEAQQKKKERLQNVLIGKVNASANACKDNDHTSNTVLLNHSRGKSTSSGINGVNDGNFPLQSEGKTLSTSPTSFHVQKSIKKEKEEKENEMIHLIPSLLDTSMIKGKMVDVACGNQHSLVLSNSGLVYSFGRNSEGQLGIGTRNREIKELALVNALADDFVIEISCGGDYSGALSDSGTLFCWGHNSCGQLGKPPIVEDNHGNGKTEIIGSKGKVMLLKTSKLNSKITKLQHGTNYSILQNSCDIPKPILGLNSGVYSDESIDRETVNQNVLNCISRLQNGIRIGKQIKPKSKMTTKLERSRLLLHSCIEAFYPHLGLKKLIKKSLVSDNHQAAAKLCLFTSKSNSRIVQAFEFTLQAFIKQTPMIPSTQLSKSIFDAFDFYLHYKENKYNEEEAHQRHSREKRQLTERLIACWQDQKFDFLQLETLLLEKADPMVLQVIVLTLFCPDEERDNLDGPLLNSTDFTGTKLVNLFTPEFCLNIGDTFVKSVVDEEHDEGFVSGSSKAGRDDGLSEPTSSNIKNSQATCGRRRKMVVSKWLEKQRSRDMETECEDIDRIDKNSNAQDDFAALDEPFTNIEDMLNVLPVEFYASTAIDAKDNDKALVENSKLASLVTDLLEEGNE